MKPKYTEISDLVLRQRDSKDPLIRKTVISLIPTLAEFDGQAFTSHGHLQLCMEYLLATLRSGASTGSGGGIGGGEFRRNYSPAVFVSVGLIAQAIGTVITPYIDPILASIKEALLSKRFKKRFSCILYIFANSCAFSPSFSRNSALDSAIFKCISTLAAAVGSTLQRSIYELLDPIFSSGLSDDLHMVLSQLSTHIPSLLPIIQGNSVCLCLLAMPCQTRVIFLPYYSFRLFYMFRKIIEHDLDFALRTFLSSPWLSIPIYTHPHESKIISIAEWTLF